MNVPTEILRLRVPSLLGEHGNKGQGSVILEKMQATLKIKRLHQKMSISFC